MVRLRSLLRRAAPRPRDFVFGPGAAAVLALLELTGPPPHSLPAMARDFLLVSCLYLLLAMPFNLLFGRDREPTA